MASFIALVVSDGEKQGFKANNHLRIFKGSISLQLLMPLRYHHIKINIETHWTPIFI